MRLICLHAHRCLLVPPGQLDSRASSEELLEGADEDMIQIPRRLVMQIYEGRDSGSLPQDLGDYLSLSSTTVNLGSEEAVEQFQQHDGTQESPATAYLGSNNPKESLFS